MNLVPQLFQKRTSSKKQLGTRSYVRGSWHPRSRPERGRLVRGPGLRLLLRLHAVGEDRQVSAPMGGALGRCGERGGGWLRWSQWFVVIGWPDDGRP